MKKLTFLDKLKEFLDIKHIVYQITLPIYLWSIGYKSLNNYIDNIYNIEKNWRG